MAFDNEIVFRIPAPSDGIETVLVLFGIGALLVVVLAGFQHRETLARRIDWLKKHPWDKANTPVNLLSWAALICVGPVAAILFVMAVDEAFELLQQAGGSESSAGSLGRGAVIVALIGAPFVVWRSVVAQKTVNVTEQGHITDRINTAVQGLGAEKTVKLPGEDEKTVANLEVRIGAIYALERIAQDSDRDHVHIIEILCAYIRQNAPAPETDDWPELEKEGENDGPLEADWDEWLGTFGEEQDERKKALKLREDIQTALTVIGRRSAKQRRLEAGRGKEAPFPFDAPCPDYDGPEDAHDRAALDAYREKLRAWQEVLWKYEGYRLDLRGADLRGADLADRDLKGARLTGTYLQEADLVEARLQGADLMGARLQGADLMGAQLQGVHFAEARLQGAKFLGARLQGSDLGQARLQGADLRLARLQGALLRRARLQGARLTAARWQGADLTAARLQGADLTQARLDKDTDLSAATLRGAALRSMDCTDIPQLAEHLDGMFGDATVILPDHVSRPEHWPTVALDTMAFHTQWRAWLENLEATPPPKPDKTA